MIIMLLSPLAASSVLRYDRSTLLEIKASVNFEDSYFIDGGQTLNFSKHLLSIPPELCRRHCGSYSKKKRRKRRGKRGGWLAKNARNARAARANDALLLRMWLLSVYPDQPVPILRPPLLQTHRRSGLTAHPYLKELKYSALAQTHSLDLIGAKAALLNVRSVRNKTFILRDFVASKD